MEENTLIVLETQFERHEWSSAKIYQLYDDELLGEQTSGLSSPEGLSVGLSVLVCLSTPTSISFWNTL